MNGLIYKQKGKDYYHRLWHTPEKNMLLFVYEGEGRIETDEGSYSITAGTLCFVGENKYHYTFSAEPLKYERSKLFLDGDTLERLLSMLEASGKLKETFCASSIAVSQLSSKQATWVAEGFKELSAIPSNAKYREEKLLLAALMMLLMLAEGTGAESKTEADSFQTVIAYVNRHITDELSIDSISEACYINKYYLCRMFKRKIGITVMEYILQTRLAMAKELLKKERMSVTRVSILAGFSSPSYFSRIFKEKTGCSPINYKKKFGA